MRDKELGRASWPQAGSNKADRKIGRERAGQVGLCMAIYSYSYGRVQSRLRLGLFVLQIHRQDMFTATHIANYVSKHKPAPGGLCVSERRKMTAPEARANGERTCVHVSSDEAAIERAARAREHQRISGERTARERERARGEAAGSV
jgi:hypothetical protein